MSEKSFFEKPIIEIKNLVVKYVEIVILDRIGFNVSQGEILTVMGGSGCGKWHRGRVLISH